MPPAASAAVPDRLSDAGWRRAFLAPLGRAAAVDDVDGLRIRLDGGEIVHFRASGNAPELRCYAEAADETAAARIVAWGLAAAAEAMRQGAGNRSPILPDAL